MFYHVYQPWKCGATSWSVVHRTSKIILSSNLACLWLSIWITVGMGMMKTIIPVISDGLHIYFYLQSEWISHIFPISSYVLCSHHLISHIFSIYFPYFPYISHIFPYRSVRFFVGLMTFGIRTPCLEPCWNWPSYLRPGRAVSTALFWGFKLGRSNSKG